VSDRFNLGEDLMTTKRRLGAPLIVMFGVIIALVAFAAPANADYAKPTTVSVSNQTPKAGSSVQFCGKGFQPGETVTIGLDNGTTYSSAVADSSGAFCSTLVLGATLTGTHTITARGATSGATASVTIVVVAGVSANASPPAAAGLAFTGAAVLGIGSLGALLLVGGAALVLAGRRRKVDA
jgi:hypothetical protein